MDMHDYFRPRFLPKVEELNKELRDIFVRYYNLSREFVPRPDSSKLKSIVDNKLAFIYVDVQSRQPDFSLIGYFYTGSTIHRFLKIILDYSLLFPINDFVLDNSSFCSGIKLEDINQNIKLGNVFKLRFLRKQCYNKIYVYDMDETPLYQKYLCPIDSVEDDLGELFFSFEGVEGLAISDIPQSLLENVYSIVGVNHYAPLTAKEANCVLFAEDNNPFDKNAIKVLRWHPQSKSSLKQFSWGDYFFELGYISRNENEELHDYMMQNHSRILFGTKEANKIKLLGGISIFFDNDFYYPKCLSQIPIL